MIHLFGKMQKTLDIKNVFLIRQGILVSKVGYIITIFFCFTFILAIAVVFILIIVYLVITNKWPMHTR